MSAALHCHRCGAFLVVVSAAPPVPVVCVACRESGSADE